MTWKCCQLHETSKGEKIMFHPISHAVVDRVPDEARHLNQDWIRHCTFKNCGHRRCVRCEKSMVETWPLSAA